MRQKQNTEVKASKTFYEVHAKFCKAMAHPTRLHVLDLLKLGEKTVNELIEEVGVAQANLSQHLAILRDVGIVETRREGPNVYYRIANPKVVEACDLVKKIVLEEFKKQQKLLLGGS
ncbi:MAG: metalloregulator ArsR/SmtB family transcription factor [Nitrososphaerota archaeon]